MKNQNGYTMIEMLTVIALVGVLLLALINIYGMHLDYYANEYERVVIQNSVKNLHLDLSREIQKAKNVVVGCGGQCLTVDSNYYTIAGSDLLRNGEKLATIKLKDGISPFRDLGYIHVQFDILFKSANHHFELIAYERVNNP